MIRAFYHVFIGLGSNIIPEKNLPAAINLLLKRGMDILESSQVFRSAAIDRPDQEDYLNCVILAKTNLVLHAVKYKLLREIEIELGRIRTGDKYAARTIDLDIIAADNLQIEQHGPPIPDPLIKTRPFLAAGLSELIHHAPSALPLEFRNHLKPPSTYANLTIDHDTTINIRQIIAALERSKNEPE